MESALMLYLETEQFFGIIPKLIDRIGKMGYDNRNKA